MSVKQISIPLYKLWVEIERLDKDGDEDHTYCPPLPDCIGVATNEEDIIRQAWAIIENFGTHPQTSDCRPDASGKFKWLRRCHTVDCNCVLCRKKNKKTCRKCGSGLVPMVSHDVSRKGHLVGMRCKDKTCPYSDHPQSWDYEKEERVFQTGEVVRLLHVPEHRLANLERLGKLQVPLVCGRRAWTPDTILEAARLLDLATPALRNYLATAPTMPPPAAGAAVTRVV